MFQIQYKRYGTGQFGEEGWEVWGEYRKFTKSVNQDIRQLKHDYLVRIISKGEPEYKK